MNARYEDYAEAMRLVVFFSIILETEEGLEQLEIH